MFNHPPPLWLCWVYLVGIILMLGLVGTSDYQEARKLECASKTNAKFIVTWDSQSDSCKKEPQNGKTN